MTTYLIIIFSIMATALALVLVAAAVYVVGMVTGYIWDTIKMELYNRKFEK